MYGTSVGDLVLGIVEIIIGDVVGKSPARKVGRCGDDTFFVLIAGEGIKRSGALQNKVRKSIQDYAWTSEAEGLRVTVSIGVVECVHLESSIDFAIRAGLGMRQAKAMRGNTVTFGPHFLPHSNAWSPTTLRVWS